MPSSEPSFEAGMPALCALTTASFFSREKLPLFHRTACFRTTFFRRTFLRAMNSFLPKGYPEAAAASESRHDYSAKVSTKSGELQRPMATSHRGDRPSTARTLFIMGLNTRIRLGSPLDNPREE
jgi:hypothetical protein